MYVFLINSKIMCVLRLKKDEPKHTCVMVNKQKRTHFADIKLQKEHCP